MKILKRKQMRYRLLKREWLGRSRRLRNILKINLISLLKHSLRVQGVLDKRYFNLILRMLQSKREVLFRRKGLWLANGLTMELQLYKLAEQRN